MLSFSSICKELQSDLEQQCEMLDIFSKNNFFWLDTIRHKVEITSLIPTQNYQRQNNDPKIGKLIETENSNLEQIPQTTFNKINENQHENIQKQHSNLRGKLCSHNYDLDSESSADNSYVSHSNRHVSFGITKDGNEQLHVLENIPIICNQDITSDILSSESESQASPIKIERVTENAASNVTPQRSSLTRQAIHASYDRFQIDAQYKQVFCIHSDTDYTSSEAINSCSTTESEPLQLDSKEENKTRKFADARDIRMSIDPTEILLSTEDYTSTNSGTFSVASNALELSLQAKLNREKWAKIVEERKKSFKEPKD